MTESFDGRPPTIEHRDVDVSEQAWGSDVLADVLKAYGFPYIPYNPGASFRGIEESIVNYNDDTPRTIEVGNEGLTVSIAHGYAKATGEPAVCALHNSVGTLNGAMSVFNAYVDRVPLVIVSGNGPLRKSRRRPWIDWIHSNLDQGSLVRDFVKWFDQPAHTDGVIESVMRAYTIADTPRKGPTYLTIDHDLQENPVDEPYEVPDLDRYAPPTGLAPDEESIERAADALVAADKPAILVDRVGTTPAACDTLIELAEILGAPVVHSRKKHRFNLPNTHPLYVDGLDVVPDADLLLALDVVSRNLFLHDADTATHEKTPVLDDTDPFVIDIGYQDVDASSLVADYHRLEAADERILADTALAIPRLVDAVSERLERDDAARRDADTWFDEIRARHDAQREAWAEAAADAAGASPIAVPHLADALWDVIRDEEWALVNGTLSGWANRLWEIDEFHQFVGGHSGGGGVGYGIGAAIGGALAYRDTDRVPINLQADGDLMQFPSGLWTLAHYDIPLLTVVKNNRTLYNSTNHRIQLAGLRDRDDSFDRALIGTGLVDPVPDYATVAEGFGVTGYGPIEDPEDLDGVLRAAFDRVRDGEPVLVDVACEAA